MNKMGERGGGEGKRTPPIGTRFVNTSSRAGIELAQRKKLVRTIAIEDEDVRCIL